ncbi:MAG TPA: PASTA domain-containing protein [Vicinamibacterales bacterium]|nr:PASTA domain-containing protein [Vicinamibacterales bacterium]
MALRNRVFGAGKVLILAGSLLATYVVFAVGAMRYALVSREVQVPDLTNRTTADASAMITDLGLTLKVDDAKRLDPRIPAGRVLAQEPAPGSTARQQRTVRVWLSAGARAAAVPAVTGINQRIAELRLSQSGIGVTTVSEIRSEDYPADAVVAQQPPAKAAAAGVALLVNRADRGITYVMPDLIGVVGDRAAEALRQRGFRASVVNSSPYPGVAPGIVLRQNPQPGFQIRPGEPISLEVSR